MRKLALAALAVVCCLSFAGSVFAAALERGELMYARSNLHAKARTIYWYSTNSYGVVIPVGDEVRFEGISTQYRRVEIVAINTNKRYSVDCSSAEWNKYFVKNKNEIGLDGLSSDKKDQIKNGIAMVGMSKAEVYASKGCPAYIAWGEKSKNKSLADIMQSDKWYYMSSKSGHDVMVTFQNGNVVNVGKFEK